MPLSLGQLASIGFVVFCFFFVFVFFLFNFFPIDKWSGTKVKQIMT